MNTKPTVRMYAPETWGELNRFSNFYSSTYTFPEKITRALSGAERHFNKALIFKNLAIKISPNLKIDQEQLEEFGYTPASNAQEMSAVIEEVFTELYSSVDCTRKVISEIHRGCRGLPESTRNMFIKVRENKVSTDFPAPLRDAILESEWFLSLLYLRDELTHWNIGHCSLNKQTGLVSYFHQGVKKNNQALNYEDVFKEIDLLVEGVNAFLGKVFRYLNSTLQENPVNQVCGIFFGRIYMRTVRPSEALDFNGGSCMSRSWFDTTEGYMCPFADECGAYIKTGAENN